MPLLWTGVRLKREIERDRGGFAVFAAFVFGLLFVLVWGVGKFRRGRKRREGGR